MDSAEQTLGLYLPLKPVANKRHRTAKSGHTYDPNAADKKEYANAARESLYARGMSDYKPTCLPIQLEVMFVFQVPKSYSNKKKTALLNGRHITKPDLDNLLKMMDAFNGVLWEDDAQIYQINAYKIYGQEAGIYLTMFYG